MLTPKVETRPPPLSYCVLMTSTGDRMRPLGANKSLIDRRWAFRMYRRLFGAEDMHTHYRWAAVSPFIDREAGRTLEVGGGDGRITFEAIDRGLGGDVTITEFDPASVHEAEQIAAAGGYNVTITQRDLRQLGAGTAFQQVLAIDVLEHIDDDHLAVQQIADALAPGGRLIVSVPTPRYPRMFGRRFHEHLGHVREGYYLEDIEPILTAAGLSVEHHRYYTGRWVSRACRLFYGCRIPYFIGVLWAPLARPALRRTERDITKREACSLALVARRG